ncbi:DNA/RNA non-specific endonuclease [[Limnothrix rosea] IAM M-220]|uniref:DNA/RNA non-specific endonuclease n=1 Tax=[Limnothrix rosea] IAM M-220 TaxID=454133 RepID=UPI00096A6830|nr:DNA/RNA non-specific endonuclease [[Limnothrix rosea] IAM M-220]
MPVFHNVSFGNYAVAIAGLFLVQSCGILTLSKTGFCPTHLPLGVPEGTPATNDLICRDIYALSSNDDTKFADWVAYRLDPSNLEYTGETKRVWQADPDIDPEETLEPDDYKGAHDALKTDRGHLAPLGSFRGKNWQQVNYLSNITPQNSKLNRGEWRELEEYVRELVQEKQEVYIITGTFYNDALPMPALPGADEPHQIPSGYWKIVMYDNVMETYLFPQEFDTKLAFRDAETSLAEIESYSGLNFAFLGDRYTEIDF